MPGTATTHLCLGYTGIEINQRIISKGSIWESGRWDAGGNKVDHRSGSHWAEPVSALGQERRKTEAQGGETPATACWQAKETESASLGGAGPVLTVGTKVQIRGCMYCAGTHPRLPGTKLRKRQMNPDALAGRHRPGWCRDECGRFNCCLAESGKGGLVVRN